MPRSGILGTYSLPGAQAAQVPGTPIPSAVNNQGYSDIEQTFNTPQPIAYGGTGAATAVGGADALSPPFTNVASAATTNIGAASSPNINITGTSTITAFDTSTSGVRRHAVFTGILTLTHNFTSLILPGGLDIVTSAGDAASIVSLGGGNWKVESYTRANGLAPIESTARGYIHGLALSNNAVDAINDVDISAGEAGSDGSVLALIRLPSPITKRLDALWASGSGNGGLDTGVISNATYHVYLIKRVDTGAVDALFSLSASSPTLPANYTLSRRIGSIIRTSGAIREFLQAGDRFYLAAPVIAYAQTNPGTSAILTQMEVPRGISVVALIHAYVIWSAAGSGGSIAALITSPSQTDIAPAVGGVGQIQIQARGATSSTYLQVQTNESRQIRFRTSGSEAAVAVYIATEGWIDTRGREA